MPDDAVLKDVAARRRAMKAAADAAVADIAPPVTSIPGSKPQVAQAKADTVVARESVAEAKQSRKAEAMRKAREQADRDALLTVPDRPLKLSEPGSTDTPLHVLNAMAKAAHAAALDDARAIGAAAGRAAVETAMHPDRIRYRRARQARREANRAQG